MADIAGDLTWVLPLTLAALLLGGTIKGIFGVGLPVTAMAILTSVLSPQIAVGVVAIPVLFGNLVQIRHTAARRAAIREHRWTIVALALSLLAATAYVQQANTSLLLAATGLTIIVFATVNLLGTPPALAPATARKLGPVAGLMAGVMGGLTTIWAPPLVMLFIAQRLPKDAFVSTIGVLLFVGSVPLVLGYALTGTLNAQTAPIGLVACIPTFVGIRIGEWMRASIDAERFRTALLIMFLLMGANILRRALI